MNYRHAFHAGGVADVFKHAVLVEVLARLLDKPTPLAVIDTHAGVGLYDLDGVEAAKTGEWRRGIGAIADSRDPALARYLALVRRFNPDGALRCYPGSPALVDAMLRPGDRLVLCELHPDDAGALKDLFRRASGVAVHHRDGYEALPALVPPPERRGLVLVDPAFEAPDEFDRLAGSLRRAFARWPGGRALVWYPVKRREVVKSFLAALPETVDRLVAELLVRPLDGVNLAGSGLVLLNPPFGIEPALEAIGRALEALRRPGGFGFVAEPARRAV